MELRKLVRITLVSILVLIPYLACMKDFNVPPGTTKMCDFGGVYFGSRCVMKHLDPYDPVVALKDFRAEGGRIEGDDRGAEVTREVFTVGVNLPTTLFLVAPIALLSWNLAQIVWLTLIALGMGLAAMAMWDLGAEYAPWITGILVCLILVNSAAPYLVGNLATIVVSCCALAMWCFSKGRWEVAGVVLLGVALVLKPHDAGLIWLYMLIAGGLMRKRALQSLGLAAVLGVASLAWIHSASPHWMGEMSTNHEAVGERGRNSDPGPSGPSAAAIGQIIDLQAALSIYRDDPGFYNPVSYVVAGIPLLIWLLAIWKGPSTEGVDWVALAPAVILVLLPVYHRNYDARLMMLLIPTCAKLWVEGGVRRWVATGLTLAALVTTGDLWIIFIPRTTHGLYLYLNQLIGEELATILLYRTAVPVLLVTGSYYVWVYVLRQMKASKSGWSGSALSVPGVAAQQ